MKCIIAFCLLLFSCAIHGQIVQNDTLICSGDSITLNAVTGLSLSSFPYIKSTGNEIFVSTNGNDFSGDGTLIQPYQTIQFAINQAVNGSIITILNGTYSGLGNTNLNLLGKQIIVQSQNGPCCTEIDGNGVNRAFLVNQGETSQNTWIQGLRIRNTAATLAPLNYGGGIFVEDNSGIGIRFCVFSDNTDGCIQFGDTEVAGPASFIESSIFTENNSYCIGASKKSFYVENCVFENNVIQSGQLCGNGHSAAPEQQYRNCLFKCNSAPIIISLGHSKKVENSLFINNNTSLGCIYMGTTWSGPNVVDHCTFYNNTSVYYTTPTFDHIGTVNNSILYPGNARNFVSGNQNSINFFNCLGGNINGNGNLSGDPLIVDYFTNNFNLQPLSPCIGTGQNGSNMGIEMSLLPVWFFSNQFSSQTLFTWSNGSTNSMITVFPESSQYFHLIFEKCGIQYVDSVFIEVSSPSISAGIDQSVCAGDNVILSGTGGSNYQWNNNVVDGQTFAPAQGNAYVVMAQDTLGCTGTDTVVVTVLENASSTLTESALDSYTLNGQIYTQSGTYTQTLTAANGCDSSITLNLTLNFTGIDELGTGFKKLVKITDLNGKKIPRRKNTLLLFIYEDGTVERVVEMEE